VLIRRRIQRVLFVEEPRPLGLPTDMSHVAGGPVDLPSPHPLGINYRPVLGLPTPNSRAGRQQVDSHTDVLNDRRSLVQLFIALLDSEKFNARYREIFSSLESRESR